MNAIPDWARAYGGALFGCRIRAAPEDFVVDEKLDIELSGAGEHDWLQIRKIGANTAWVAGRLAKHAAVPERDVGFAGLKDRHAVTTQWFSVRRPSAAGTDWNSFAAEGVEIIDIGRHERKLRRGAHRGNAFQIVLGDLDTVVDDELIDARVQQIALHGVPNYFGEQRFGHGGSNLGLGRAVLDGRRMSRNKRSIGLSALRSFDFNGQLDSRVRDGTWNRLLRGDVANLDGSNSVFDVDEVTPDLERRCSDLDVHPAGSLPAIEKMRVDAAHRPFRMRVHDPAWQRDGDMIRLEFRLGRGSFATSVLRELADYKLLD